MIPVSTRRLPWLLGALLLAAPLIYANLVRTQDECGSGDRAVLLTGVEGTERVERYRESTFQWTSREETAPGTLSHAVIRARAPRVLANTSSSARPLTILPSRSEVRRISHDGIELPIHFSRAEIVTQSEFVVHLFLYRGRPVEDFLPHQLATAWEQLLFGRRPVTVLLAWGIGTPEQRRKLEEEATQWIVETWEQFESQCGS